MMKRRIVLFSCLVSLSFAACAATIEEAENALAAGNVEIALDAYLTVLEEEPDNLTALQGASQLSLEFGMTDLALELALQTASTAAANFDKSAVQEANETITLVRQQLEPWVDDALAAAAEYEDSQQSVVDDWQALTGEGQQALAAGDIEGALGAQETALLIVEETFGPEHWLTISAMRDLGFIYRQAGRGAEADSYYGAALASAEAVLGPDHPQTLEILGLMAELYVAAGDPEQGIAMNETVVTGYEQTVGSDHAYTMGARLGYVEALESAGQYEEAIVAAFDLCGDLASSWGEYHGYRLACLESLGSLQLTAGHLEDAEKTYLQISGVMGRSLPSVDRRILSNLSVLGEIYRQQGRYDESERVLSGVIQLALQVGNLEASAEAKSYLGRVFNNTGELEKALTVTEEVLDYGIDHWQQTPINVYNTLLELGAIYQALGRLPEAEATFSEALAGLLQNYGEMNPSTLVASNNLGQLYEAIGLYDEAEPILESALERYEAVFGEAHPDAMRARNNLALLHESQGNFREAEPLYQQSLDLMLEAYGENYTDTVAVRNNLAFLWMLMEEFEQSAAMFELVVNSWEQLLGAEHPNTLKAVNNLARVYLKMDRTDEAAPLFDRALEARARVLGENHVDTIRSLVDYSGLLLAQGDLDAAEERAVDALSRAEEYLGEQHPYAFDALNMLVDIRRAQGDLAGAIELAQTGMSRRSVFFDRMLWSTGQNAREGFIRLHRPELDRYLSMLAEQGGDEAGRRMLQASLQRKGLLLKITSEIQQIGSLGNDPALASIVSELQSARQDLAALTLSGPTPETQGRHAEVLYELEQQVNDLQAELGRASARYRTSISQMSVEDLVDSMPDDAALVDFLVYRDGDADKMLAGVILKEDGDVQFDLVGYESLGAVQDAVLEYRRWIQDDLADELDILETGSYAYEQVWQPLGELLADQEYVYVIPDGVLNILPFAALVNEDEEYLIEHVDLHLLTSARDLLPNQYQLAEGEYIIVAGPDYDSEDVVSDQELAEARGRRSTALQLGLRGAGSGLRGLSFAPLPGAREEGRIINEQVEARNEPNIVYFGGDAQEVVLAELSSPPEILHMATHGFFLEADEELRRRLLKAQRSAELQVPPPGDNPLLRSGLAFAGINTNAQFLGDIDTDNDGVLTALEVLDLDLSGTQLVVLSACETGLGEIHEGEGVYGLRRSFQEAGVAEVISSLWEVSDAGTQALMTGFYDRLLEGVPARVALREAQLELMESPQWGYPYVWSAFMIVGSYESAGFSVN